MAGDQPRDGMVTAGPSRLLSQLVAALGALVVLLGVLAVVGGVFVFREHQVSSRDSRDQERYGAVQQAAADEVSALLNIDYRTPQDTIDKVKAGATAEFAEQFDAATGGLVQLIAQAKSVMTAEVHWTGVVDVDPDSASVIVATSGTVTNTLTGEQPAARNFRIKVDLVQQDGRWLTSALDFVPVVTQ